MNQVISTQGLLGCHPIKQLAPTPLETYSFFRALWWHNFFIQKMILLCFKPSKIHRVPEFTWITYFHFFGFPSSQFTNSRNKRGIAYFGVGSSWSTGPRHFRKISLGHLVLGFICPEPMLWKIRISWGATLQGPPPLVSHDGTDGPLSSMIIPCFWRWWFFTAILIYQRITPRISYMCLP